MEIRVQQLQFKSILVNDQRFMKFKKNNSIGFSLVELMTALVITGILTAVSIPAYRAYVTKTTLAEALTVIDVMDKNQLKYFAENGAFISAEPNPALAPGIDGVGKRGSFGTSNQWSALGLPVSSGSAVIFSYQAFAGQTEKTSSTPIESATLYSPNDEMDLVRSGLYNASLEFVPMKNYTLHAKDFELDFGLNFCATAADGYQACIDACRGDARCESECVPDSDPKDEVPSDGACYGDYPLDPDCVCDEEGTRCGRNEIGGGVNARAGGACTMGDPIIDPRDGSQSCAEAEGDDTAPEGDGDESGGGGDSEGDPGDEGGGGDGGESIAENTCASFGVSRPVHFGVQEGLADYSWVINSAVTNQREGADCWLVVQLIQVINGNTATSASIQINPGE